jgi:transcriptional regulator with XRE-family HTH domain
MAPVTGYKVKRAKQSGAERRMTQTQAARVLGVSRGHLNRVIHGARPSQRIITLYQELMAMPANKTKTKT